MKYLKTTLSAAVLATSFMISSSAFAGQIFGCTHCHAAKVVKVGHVHKVAVDVYHRHRAGRCCYSACHRYRSFLPRFHYHYKVQQHHHQDSCRLCN